MRLFDTQDRRRTAALAALILLGLTAAYVLVMSRDMSDFGVCYQAGQRIRAGETLYRASDGHLQFKYAPLSAVLYAPLSLLPRAAADAAWFAVCLALLSACAALAYRTLSPPRRPAFVLLGLAFLTLAKFIGREFILGQVNLLILALILTALAAYQSGRDVPAGLFWAASLFFKPYALIFLPYFILKKRGRLVAAGAAALAAGLALPALFYGWSGNLRILSEWAATLTQSTSVLLEVGDNASLYALLAKHLGPGSLAGGLFLAATAGLAAAVLGLMARSRKGTVERPETLDFAFLLVLVPLLSPLGWYYNYLYGLPAVVVLLNVFGRMSPAWKAAAVADLLLIGATLRETLGRTVFRFYTRHSLVAVCFLVVLALLAAARRRDQA